MSWYCDVAKGHPWHGPYHDTEYGFPVGSEPVLLERLALEINQAGLSWLTVLKKREAFSRAFAGFDVDRVAGFTDADRMRLLANADIIRNIERHGREVEDALDAGGDHLVGDLLSAVGRNSQDAHADAAVLDQLRQRRDRQNGQ